MTKFSLSLLPVVSLAVSGVLLTPAAPASATVYRLNPIVKDMRLALPMEFEKAMENDFLGLDQESDAAKAKVAAQTEEYLNYRRGRMSTAQANAWLEKCAKSEAQEDNYFCRYEVSKSQGRAHASKALARSASERRRILSDLRDSRFEKVSGKNHMDVVGAVSLLEQGGHLNEVAEKVANMKACVPTSVSTALGYKLEERFPATETVDLSSRLYRKSIECGKDAAAAQASFRLGLIEIWHKRCDEIPELMAKVEATAEASQFHPRAKFWRYYCATVNGDASGKEVAKATLMKDHPMSFQTLAATGEDDDSMARILSAEPPRVSVRSVIRPDLNGLLRATEGLIRAGATPFAADLVDRNLREVKTFEPEVRLYVAVMLNRIGFALPKFKIMSDLFQDSPRMVSAATLRLFFPLWYYEMVRAKQEKVDPLLILSLIRQESAFNKAARSIAGARGLMQVMPATARTVASVRTQKLLDPETNIGIGTKYFLKRLEQYDGDVELTLAAYNAGFMRVDQWKKRYPTDNKLLFLDFIPFKETRDYVSSILRNYYWYVKLYSADASLAQANDGAKIQNTSAKALAIISANAGAAAMPAIVPLETPTGAAVEAAGATTMNEEKSEAPVSEKSIEK